MTIWTWIFGVGFFLLAIIVFIIDLKHKKLETYRRVGMMTSVGFTLLGISIPVLLSDVVSNETFSIILFIDIPLTLIIFYVGAVLSLRSLHLLFWSIPYDNEKEKRKLTAQKEATEKVVYGYPVFAIIFLIIIVGRKYFGW